MIPALYQFHTPRVFREMEWLNLIRHPLETMKTRHGTVPRVSARHWEMDYAILSAEFCCLDLVTRQKTQRVFVGAVSGREYRRLIAADITVRPSSILNPHPNPLPRGRANLFSPLFRPSFPRRRESRYRNTMIFQPLPSLTTRFRLPCRNDGFLVE